MNTTKNMIILALLFGMTQACAPTIEKTEEAAEWLAIADGLDAAQYMEMVQNHPMTQNVEDDLEQMGCSIEFDDSRVEETRVENLALTGGGGLTGVFLLGILLISAHYM